MGTSGETLRWALAYNHWRQPLPGNGVVPFLISWGDGASPPMSVAPGLQLKSLEFGHPDPASLRPALEALGFSENGFQVKEQSEVCIALQLETPKGPITL